MAGYRLRALARNDLEAIWAYTVETWGIQQAERYFESLFVAFDELANNPQMGRTRDEVLPGLRSFPQGRHVVFYEVDGPTITIIGIVHQSADVNRHLSMT
ncbi:MAG: type II toxin-antitoxin system RelE/ParE family toxin [Gammaproteobacteria bacterium]|nr:type II toxin-antitoxin system RelE/ParE family toxin [Gammaproteobacteria bacterium]MCP5138084.1 type II toxin-antitoxin system RelE/ParE family toxin [Gammaproteobacteria bacterium]